MPNTPTQQRALDERAARAIEAELQTFVNPDDPAVRARVRQLVGQRNTILRRLGLSEDTWLSADSSLMAPLAPDPPPAQRGFPMPPLAQVSSSPIRSAPSDLDPFRFQSALPASVPRGESVQALLERRRVLEEERASLLGLPPEGDGTQLGAGRLAAIAGQIAAIDAALQRPLRPRDPVFGPEPLKLFDLPPEAVQPPPQRARPNPSAGPPIFSGCDIIPVINANGQVLVLGNILALSYSIHRDKTPVRVLGRTYAKSYCRGSRSIAGSLISVVFDQAALSEVMDLYGFELASDDPMTTLVPDQMPPFDITITYWSETADTSGGFRGAYMKLFGVEIVDEGQSHSINDLYVENQMQFVCQDIEHLIPVSDTVTGADGGLKRVSPFQRALFQAQIGELGVSDADEALRTIGATRTALHWKMERLQETIDHLDQYGIPDPSGRTRAQLFEAYDRASRDYDQSAKALNDANRDKLAGEATRRVRSITDPTRNFHDQPFDYPAPRRL